jgi:hypothetical protein
MTEIHYGSDGSTISETHSYQYDDKGKQVEEKSYYRIGNDSDRIKSKYNDLGQLTEESLMSADKLLDITSFTRDDKGNITRERTFDNHKQQLEEIVVKYEYDTAGNWTRQSAYASGRDGKPQPTKIIERRLTYY